MSKISIDFKLKDLYAIKHALESQLKVRHSKINQIQLSLLIIEDKEIKTEKYKEIELLKRDIKREENIINNLVEIINRYKRTEAHLPEVE